MHFADGTDYLVDRDRRTLHRMPGSRMPFVTPDTIASADGALTHDRIVAVSYTHAPDATLWSAAGSAIGQLPRFAGRLRRGEPITIAVTGDSISEGYDVSGFHRIAPHQPPYATLVATALERQSGAAVRLHNCATAGWTVADGMWDTDRVVAAEPDLAIVAYGMNDATYATGDEFAANIAELLQRIRAGAPAVEFLLVSPMLPTPECAWVKHEIFPEYRARLAAMAAEGVGFVDVMSLWAELVARKGHYSLSGNGLNHPNDFGHRVYADAILAALR